MAGHAPTEANQKPSITVAMARLQEALQQMSEQNQQQHEQTRQELHQTQERLQEVEVNLRHLARQISDPAARAGLPVPDYPDLLSEILAEHEKEIAQATGRKPVLAPWRPVLIRAPRGTIQLPVQGASPRQSLPVFIEPGGFLFAGPMHSPGPHVQDS